MYLTIDCDSPEFSFLLHKHPAKVHSKETNFGEAHVFYPSPQRVSLLLQVDPLSLTRRGGGHVFALKPYVNDRGYVASSFLSVGLNLMFRTAMAGRCPKHPELVEKEFAFRVEFPVLPSRGGEKVLEKLFAPLGYQVESSPIALDDSYPEWGNSPYYKVVLRVVSRLQDLLRHLYVLIPVLDNEKHYWVGSVEVSKLLAKGDPWLAEHPEKEMIAHRYLKHRRGLARQALEVLQEEIDDPTEVESLTEDVTERKIGLHQQRLETVSQRLLESGATIVGDLGCGEGKLLRYLLKGKRVERILAMDVCLDSLQRAESSLERLHHKKREKIELLHGSLLYNDDRLKAVEAACLVEVIEHLEPDRLNRVAANLFQRLKPQTLILTTPNREYNAVWESLPAGKFRHPDHRFEWTRAEFEQWAGQVKDDYEVSIEGIGEPHPDYGCPTQMAVFTR